LPWQGQPEGILIPAANCESLHDGLLECHDTTALLAEFVLNVYDDDKGMYAALCLLQHRICGLPDLISPYMNME
jgi:hypothetical protein